MTGKDFQKKADYMVNNHLIARGISREIAEIIRQVPREIFVPEESRQFAYSDSPLSIGSGQTISQPYIVAEMTELLKPEKGVRVLEVGAGSGYQAAILARMGAEVYAVEVVPELAREAKKRLNKLGLKIKIRVGDGTPGWPEEAPFDRIIVSAASPSVPEPLLKQLKSGGRMVIPVGSRAIQELKLVVKYGDGKVKEFSAGGCRFVPLIGRYGWSES